MPGETFSAASPEAEQLNLLMEKTVAAKMISCYGCPVWICAPLSEGEFVRQLRAIGWVGTKDGPMCPSCAVSCGGRSTECP